MRQRPSSLQPVCVPVVAVTRSPDSPQPHPQSPAHRPSLGLDLVGALLTRFSLAGRPWPELPVQQVSLGRGGRQLTPTENGPGADPVGLSSSGGAVLGCRNPPTPPLVSPRTVRPLSSPRGGCSWSREPGGGVMFTVLSAPRRGLPEDASLNLCSPEDGPSW